MAVDKHSNIIEKLEIRLSVVTHEEELISQHYESSQ
jgi:hypothetical protein